MRTAGLTLFVALCAPALGQVSLAEEPIQRALEALRSRPGVRLELIGSETVGSTTIPFSINAMWFQSTEDGKPMSKVEMIGTRNGQTLFRLVGDGTTLWAWNARRNEYIASRYGSYRGVQSENYLVTLFNSLGSLVNGHASLPARLLAETYGGEAAMYRTWMPGVTAENTGALVRYQLSTPVRRRYEFWYSEVTPYLQLDRVEYFDTIYFGATRREVAWTMSVTALDLVLDEQTFAFTPPTGSRAVVALRPVSGG